MDKEIRRMPISSLAIQHEIQLPQRPGARPSFIAVYSTVLRSGKKIRSVGYDGLCAALAEIRAEIDAELLRELDVEKKRLLSEQSKEIATLLEDYLPTRRARMEQSEALQRNALEVIAQSSIDETGLPIGPYKDSQLSIQTVFIGSGSGRSTLLSDGEEVEAESTAAELLNLIQEKFRRDRKLSL